MKIKKNDTVLIISGKDRSRKGKVIEAFPAKGKVIVEGMNIRKKHVKPKKSGAKGQLIESPGLISVSNVKIICPKCGVAARLGYKPKTENQKTKIKIRVCKKCGQEI
ncbi:MAG: 50S ribosomal protein L24 [bacterium]